MKKLAWAHRLLWSFNVLLAGAILLFVFTCLIFPKKRNLLEEIDGKAEEALPVLRRSSSVNFELVKNLRFPLKPPDEPKAPPRNALPAFAARLDGIASGTNRGEAAAFITVGGRSLVAYSGEVIEEGGDPVPELRGWKLVESYTRDGVAGATFTNGTQTITIYEDGTTETPPRPGDPARKG